MALFILYYFARQFQLFTKIEKLIKLLFARRNGQTPRRKTKRQQSRLKIYKVAQNRRVTSKLYQARPEATFARCHLKRIYLCLATSKLPHLTPKSSIIREAVPVQALPLMSLFRSELDIFAC